MRSQYQLFNAITTSAIKELCYSYHTSGCLDCRLLQVGQKMLKKYLQNFQPEDLFNFFIPALILHPLFLFSFSCWFHLFIFFLYSFCCFLLFFLFYICCCWWMISSDVMYCICFKSDNNSLCPNSKNNSLLTYNKF